MFSDSKNVLLVPFFEAASAYQSKGVGVDMSIKSVLGIIRLLGLYSKDAIWKQRYDKMSDVMVECRMLCNFGRMWITMRQFLQTYRLRGRMGAVYNLFLCLSHLFRIPEQGFGDLSYLQKVIFHHWSRQRLSFFYRFFKSLSLSCCFISEIAHRRSIRKKIAESTTSKERVRFEMDLSVCNAIAVRSLCDMYVYFKWIPGYTPIRTLEYIFGSISGMIGVWLVWKDIRSACPCLPQTERKLGNCTKSSSETLEKMLTTGVDLSGDEV
ncbi:unnamed protein product [Phytomonas sp. EM1]|nr:unnamed protein product [Phytomonas sp. EM1]|eukprot:CCW63246.1 unnamed protein product [Phytomonas sp. isolate EM1]